MAKEEKKAIEIVAKYLNFNEICGTRNFKEALETVLNMLKEKDKEIEKKDKIIDLMAYSLADYVMYYEYSKCRNPVMIKDKAEELKEYYERKAEND